MAERRDWLGRAIDWERLRTTENDWERLGSAPTRRRDHGTARLRDDRTTRLRDDGTTRRRDGGTARQRDCGTTGRRDCGTTRRRDDETTRPQDTLKNTGVLRRSQPFSGVLRHSQAFPVARSRARQLGVRVVQMCSIAKESAVG